MIYLEECQYVPPLGKLSSALLRTSVNKFSHASYTQKRLRVREKGICVTVHERTGTIQIHRASGAREDLIREVREVLSPSGPSARIKTVARHYRRGSMTSATPLAAFENRIRDLCNVTTFRLHHSFATYRVRCPLGDCATVFSYSSGAALVRIAGSHPRDCCEEALKNQMRAMFPVNVVVALDCSYSMTGLEDRVRECGERVILETNERAAVRVIIFSDIVSTLYESPAGAKIDQQELREALEEYNCRGPTALFDAVGESARMLSKAGLIMLVTDGQENASKISFEACKEICQEIKSTSGELVAYTAGGCGHEQLLDLGFTAKAIGNGGLEESSLSTASQEMCVQLRNSGWSQDCQHARKRSLEQA